MFQFPPPPGQSSHLGGPLGVGSRRCSRRSRRPGEEADWTGGGRQWKLKRVQLQPSSLESRGCHPVCRCRGKPRRLLTSPRKGGGRTDVGSRATLKEKKAGPPTVYLASQSQMAGQSSSDSRVAGRDRAPGFWVVRGVAAGPDGPDSSPHHSKAWLVICPSTQIPNARVWIWECSPCSTPEPRVA